MPELDDDLRAFKGQISPRPVCCCVVGSLTTVMGLYIWIVSALLGRSMFFRYESPNCWYVDGLEIGRTSREAAITAASSFNIPYQEPINVHGEYLSLYTWAFWMAMIPLLAAPCYCLGKVTAKGKYFGHFVFLISSVVQLMLLKVTVETV